MNLSEVEMREFFAKVVDTVNDLSNQAGLVSGLQQQVNDLRDRLSQVEADNQVLRQQLTEAQSQVANWQRNSDTANEAARIANEQINALRETVIQADHRVASLGTELKNEQDGHRITKADLDDSRRAVQERDERIGHISAARDEAQSLVREWQDRSNKFERENAELRTKLDRIGAMFQQSNVTPFPPFSEQAAS
jgi:chromosome segregation ATPase